MNERQRETVERARALCMRSVQDVEVESALEAAIELEHLLDDDALRASRPRRDCPLCYGAIAPPCGCSQHGCRVCGTGRGLCTKHGLEIRAVPT